MYSSLYITKMYYREKTSKTVQDYHQDYKIVAKVFSDEANSASIAPPISVKLWQMGKEYFDYLLSAYYELTNMGVVEA